MLRLRRSRRRTFHHHRLQRGLTQLHITAIGAIHGDRQGNAASLGQQAARDAAFPAVGRIGTGPFSPKGALVIAPSIACPSQAMPTCASETSNPARQSRSNTPARAHARKRSETVLDAPTLRGSAFHWQPVRSTETMASMA